MHPEAHLSRVVALGQEGPEALDLSFLVPKRIPQNSGAYPEQPVPGEPCGLDSALQLPVKPGNSVELESLPSRGRVCRGQAVTWDAWGRETGDGRKREGLADTKGDTPRPHEG